MEKFKIWFAESPVASWARAFTAIVITLAVAEWVTTKDITFTSWETWVIAALGGTVPTAMRWWNPEDPEFGRFTMSFIPDDTFDVFADEDEEADNA